MLLQWHDELGSSCAYILHCGESAQLGVKSSSNSRNPSPSCLSYQRGDCFWVVHHVGALAPDIIFLLLRQFRLPSGNRILFFKTKQYISSYMRECYILIYSPFFVSLLHFLLPHRHLFLLPLLGLRLRLSALVPLPR